MLRGMLVALVFMMSGCSSKDTISQDAGYGISLGRDDPLPSFDVYLTWEGYEPEKANSRDARYIWNGESIGQGSAGVKTLLTRLQGLKVGSRVLIYPSCDETLYSGSFRPTYPYQNWYTEIIDVVRSRHLFLIMSPRDHLGNLHPQCVSRYYGRPDLDVLAGPATQPAARPHATMPAETRPPEP